MRQQLTSANLAALLNGEVVQDLKSPLAIAALAFDSRSAQLGPETVFFALLTSSADGQAYLPEVYQKGCRCWVVHTTPAFLPPDVYCIKVSNTLAALQAIAAHHRTQFDIPILAITGSNGKTQVKEWLTQLIGPEQVVCKSPKSYNSQIGVPISVWELSSQHDLGIFEAGISQPGEMAKLQQIIQPTEGIFINIGDAHDQAFTSRNAKALEKMQLFTACQCLFFSADYDEIKYALAHTQCSPSMQHCTWSLLNHEADLQLIAQELQGAHTLLQYRFRGIPFGITVPFSGHAAIENLTACLAVLLYHNFDLDVLQERINQIRNLPMRLEQVVGLNQCILLNDSYSLDLDSLRLALDSLKRIPFQGQRTVILSDFAYHETWRYEKALHDLQQAAVDAFISIGPQWQSFMRSQQGNLTHYAYPNVAAFIAQHPPITKQAILIKGARIFQLEQIVQALAAKIHHTRLEIDLDALVHNLNVYKSMLGNVTKLMVMVKASGYGTGSEQIARLLAQYNVHYLAVAYTDEGIQLRNTGITLPIMVMNTAEDAFALQVTHQLEPVIYSLRMLQQLVAFTTNTGKTLAIHLEVETGMNRLGLNAAELTLALPIIAENNIKIKSIFSHLAASDEAEHDAFTHKQIQALARMGQQVEHALGYKPMQHIANTAAISRFPEARLDMVRLGIGLYGIDTAHSLHQRLKEVTAFKTIVSQIKELQTGESVSYGRKARVTQPMRIATLAVGYADGLPRLLGHGKASFWWNGHLLPTVGAICMDMCMVDIGALPIQEGDEVQIFGPDWSIQHIADFADTIPYEILAGIPARVHRIYINS